MKKEYKNVYEKEIAEARARVKRAREKYKNEYPEFLDPNDQKDKKIIKQYQHAMIAASPHEILTTALNDPN